MGRTGLVFATVLLLVPIGAMASQVTVPDDYSTIQAALDSGADTVLVREGNYPEALTMSADKNQRLLAAPGSGGGIEWKPLPVVESLTDAPARLLDELRGIVFTGPVNVSGGTISGCWFGSGLTLGARTAAVWNNIVFGNLSGGASHLSIAMNTVVGGTITANPLGDGYIRRNVVVGPAETGMRLESESRVMDNHVRGCGTGIHVSGELTEVQGNVVEDCTGTGLLMELVPSSSTGPISNSVLRCGGDGIQVTGGSRPMTSGNTVDDVAGIGLYVRSASAMATGNTITNTTGVGVDIVCTGEQPVHLSDNRVIGSGSDGAVVTSAAVRVQGNVVGRSGGHGVSVAGEDVLVRSNTFYLNGEAGVSLSGGSPTAVDSVDHNIAYQNGIGLEWLGSGTAVLGCNDWYENSIANTQGISPGATDLCLNPLFCDVSADDVSLSAESPLLNAINCGLIGALGEGCSISGVAPPTPAAVSGLVVSPQPSRGEVRLSWRATEQATEVAVYDAAGARRWSAPVEPGSSSIVWRGMDDGGKPLPAGVYFARIVGQGQRSARLVLVR